MAFFEELGKKAQAVAGVAAEKAKDLAGVASEKAKSVSDSAKASPRCREGCGGRRHRL